MQTSNLQAFVYLVIALFILLFYGCTKDKETTLEGFVVDGKYKPISGVRIIAEQVQR